KEVEQHVIELIGEIVGAPAASRWGFVTSSSSAAIEHAMLQARIAYPDVVVYASRDAHRCVTTSARKLAIPLVTIRTDDSGAMDIDDLRAELGHRRDRAAFVLATLGTTWSEAIDDITAIGQVFDELALDNAFLHADAALSGLPLALEPAGHRPAAT